MDISEENQIWLNWIGNSQNKRLVIEIGPNNTKSIKLIILEKGLPKFITKKGSYSLDLLISEVKEQFGLHNLSNKIFPNQL